MVLSYATGLWRFKVASLLASSMEVAELVASLMAESDGKNGGSCVLVAKSVETNPWKIELQI